MVVVSLSYWGEMASNRHIKTLIFNIDSHCYDSDDVETRFGRLPVLYADDDIHNCTCWFCRTTTHLLRVPIPDPTGRFHAENITAIYTPSQVNATTIYPTPNNYDHTTLPVFPIESYTDLPCKYMLMLPSTCCPSIPRSKCINHTNEDDYDDYMVVDGTKYYRYPLRYSHMKELEEIYVTFEEPIPMLQGSPTIYIELLVVHTHDCNERI